MILKLYTRFSKYVFHLLHINNIVYIFIYIYYNISNSGWISERFIFFFLWIYTYKTILVIYVWVFYINFFLRLILGEDEIRFWNCNRNYFRILMWYEKYNVVLIIRGYKKLQNKQFIFFLNMQNTYIFFINSFFLCTCFFPVDVLYDILLHTFKKIAIGT